MSTAKNSFRVDALQVQVYNSEVELAQDVAEIAQKHLQHTLGKMMLRLYCWRQATPKFNFLML
jgi:hypothetical protein